MLNHIQGQRVALRKRRAEDRAAIEAWLDEALASAGSPHPHPLSRSAGEGRSGDSRAAGVFVIERIAVDEPVGLVEYSTTDGCLAVEFIALAKAYRGWGYGSEAVRLLEEGALSEGIAKRFRTKIDVRNGLGLYFWLRLGYRPAGPDAAERDVMTIVREIDS